VLDYAVCHWIVFYTVHFTAFCLGGRFFPDTVYKQLKPDIMAFYVIWQDKELGLFYSPGVCMRQFQNVLIR